MNRAVATRDQLGKIRRVHYDILGRMDWVEVPLDQANGKYLRTRLGFNELGQKVWQQDAKGVATDRANGLNVDTDAPVSRVTRFAYDKRGRLVARVLPGTVDGTVNGVPLNEAMEYNVLGQLTRKRDFRGYWTSFEYDVRGRLTAKIPSASLNEMPVEYSYPDELTMTSRRGNVTTTQHYDSDRGWLNQVESPNGTLNFSHNVFGQMTGMGVVSGGTTRTTNYGYDELSRLKQITSFNGDVWNYGYDEVGNKASLSRPNGVTTTYGYDTLNRLTDLANVKGSTTLSRFNYRLRADGRRDQLNETIAQPNGTSVTRAIQYSFDDANRLTAESGTDGSGKNYSKTYTLDEAGNRQKLVATLDSSTTTTNYSYNDLDWMTQQSVIAPSTTTTTNYAYDANGSQTGITAQIGANAPTYTKQVWDFEGHLTARGATDSSGNWGSNRNEYSYDANGLRLSQSTVGSTGTVSNKTSYLWNGDRLLEERDLNGALQARYEHGQELGPLSMLRPATSTVAAQTRYFIGDGQDSTRQLLDESGAVKDSYFYDSFGVDLSGGQQTSTNSFKYTGQQQDESGLYYLRARYYEAGSGRFLSHDPEMGSSDDPISMHRYLYAGADGVNNVDPSGREYSLSGIGVASSISSSIQSMTANIEIQVLDAVSNAFGVDLSYEGVGAAIWNKNTGFNMTGDQVREAEKIAFYAFAGWHAGRYAFKGIKRAGNAFRAQTRAVSEAVEQLGGGTFCFVAGTPVLMADGSLKPIEQIRVGDRVLSRDEKTGETKVKAVESTTKKQAPSTLVLTFSNHEKIETTKDHPFYVEGKGFVKAANLAVGNSIVTRAGPSLRVLDVEHKNSPATVYNFSVEDFHTYFVGDSHLWVHNANCAKRNAEGLFENGLAPKYDQEWKNYANNARTPGPYGSGGRAIFGGINGGLAMDMARGWAEEEAGRMIYVVMPNGELRLALEESGYMFHSVLAEGSAVRAAGTVDMKIVDGELKVTEIGNKTGHYNADPESMDDGLKALSENGFDISEAQKVEYQP